MNHRTLFILGIIGSCSSIIIAQRPVAAYPEIFGTLPNVRDFAPTVDGNTIYFTMETPKKEFSTILRVDRKGKKWGKPEVASFSGQFKDLEPFITPDGQRLYFVSSRPKPGATAPADMDIWYVERKGTGIWGEPQHLGPEINTDRDEYYPSLPASGHVYFTRESDDATQKEDIFRAEWNGTSFKQAAALPEAINGKTYEYNAYISPDEQVLIFTSYGRADDLGGSDLYYTRKNTTGEWMPAKHLGGEINSKKIDYCPWWDVKTGILYFTSERSEIPRNLEGRKTFSEIMELSGQYSNGTGRIYQVPFTGKE